MSHSDSHDQSVHSHEHGHGHGHDEHANHGSLRSYLTGFVLAVILTVIPFWLVMGHVFQNHWLTITIVLLLAIVQILVHVVYFLHLDTRAEGGWNMLSFIFTIVLVLIVLGASTWVMYNENANMMPMSPQYQHNTDE
jgi:cytochrome o ubiquinol oxidase operon protein cyoD